MNPEDKKAATKNLHTQLCFKLNHAQQRKEDNEDENVLGLEGFLDFAEEKRLGLKAPQSVVKAVLIKLQEKMSETFDEPLGYVEELVDERYTFDELADTSHIGSYQPSIENRARIALNQKKKGESKTDRINRSTEVITEGFKQDFPSKAIFSDQDSPIYFYEDGVYYKNGSSKIDEYTRKALGQDYTQRIGSQVQDKVRADSYIDEDEFFKVRPERLCVSNGVLNLRRQRLMKHAPYKTHFQKLNVAYNEEASYEALREFLVEVVGEDQLDVVQEVFGFCLYRQYFLKKAVIFKGDADNGKSTVLQILTHLIGDENISAIPLQSLGERFQSTALHHKLANIVGDLSGKELKELGMFKSLTGRDQIPAEIKGGRHFRFENYAKLIYSTNKLPTVTGATPAFFSRWLIINFPYTFVSPSEYEKYSEEEREAKGIKKAQPNVLQDLFKEQTMSGVLNFAVEGLQRLLENKEFSYTRSRQENMIEWIRQSSTFQAFTMDCLEESPDQMIVKKDLREAYYKYCRIHDVTAEKNERAWKDHLLQEFKVDEQRPTIGNQRQNCWVGVKFQEPYEAPWKTLVENQSSYTFDKEKHSEDVDEAVEEAVSAWYEDVSTGDKVLESDVDFDAFPVDKFDQSGSMQKIRPGVWMVVDPAKLLEDMEGYL